jgi:hypothetical protein
MQVPKGTTIVWFNGDVDHDHKITLTRQNDNPSSTLFDSDVLPLILHHNQS